MEIYSTGAATSTSSLRTLEDLQNRSANKELDKDAFLKILVMQLSNQNPLEPSSDTEFIAQLTQFSMLEQIQNLNTSFTTSQSFNMTGKYVYVENELESGETEMVFGKVNGVIKQEGLDYLLIGDNKYLASKVVGVLDSLDDETALDSNILNSSNLIGKTVTATYLNDEQVEVTVTGTVDKITIKDGVIFATVDGQEILLSDIDEITYQDSTTN